MKRAFGGMFADFAHSPASIFLPSAGCTRVILKRPSAQTTVKPSASTATTSPTGLATSLTFDGSPTVPSGAGSYVVVATINDPDYTGTTTDSLVIDKAPTTVTLADLNHVFFTNSGSESVDTALKIALAYHRARGEGQRTRIIGRERGYHGVGFGGLGVGGIAVALAVQNILGDLFGFGEESAEEMLDKEDPVDDETIERVVASFAQVEDQVARAAHGRPVELNRSLLRELLDALLELLDRFLLVPLRLGDLRERHVRVHARVAAIILGQALQEGTERLAGAVVVLEA